MEEIERLAEAFLDRIPVYVWDGATLPVPIEEIADSYAGLLVRDVEDLSRAPGAPPLGAGQALSGLLLPDAGEIWVNAGEARQWPARRRFTIAHELGHWELHRHASDAVFCRAASIDAADPETDPAVPAAPSLPLTEDEANAFGAAVLMPARLLRARYGDPDRDFTSLCRAFGASGAAMGRRLHAVIERAPRQRGADRSRTGPQLERGR
jgi:hypothetical protein